MVVTGSLLCLNKSKMAYIGWLSIFAWIGILIVPWWGIPGAIVAIIGTLWSLYIRKRFGIQ